MGKIKKERPTRKPSHPGEILKDLWLGELGYTQSHFAEQLVAASKSRIKKSTMQTKLNEIINGKRAMSADFAVLISKVLKTNPRMWMSLQTQLDIWLAETEAA
ncbi:MAG: HigA family addiction module antitoxin [Bdellovibrionaceae bacterium]|nr:HigA family addiction module antitoxin [Pseudobdellovibrionaceae bacterium]